jgi:hypothetical protein
MNKQEILHVLGKPHDYYYSSTGNVPALVLSFDGEVHTEQELKNAAEALTGLVPGGGCFLRINREAKNHTYQIAIGLKQSEMIALNEVAGLEVHYNDLLELKSSGRKIAIVLDLYNVKVERTETELTEIRARADFDPQAAVTGEEPYYKNVKVPIGAHLFDIRSDDNYTEGPAAFSNISPAEALAATAHYREDAMKKKQE